jgi:purine-nucleoside phosphorylase
MPLTYREKVEQAFLYIRQKHPFKPEIIILLGTGLGGLASAVEEAFVLPYEAIPHFCGTTVDSHEGSLIFGRLAGKNVAILKGRNHFYEGYSTQDIAFPIRVLSLLGSSYLIVSNAAGGLNPKFSPGSLMIITDHINFIPENPLRGENIDDWGPRFPDMSETYEKALVRLVWECAALKNIPIQKGTYACIPGPSLETAAETRFYRNCGADAIGMSTVPEVIVGKHAGMKVLGISVIANLNDPDNFQPILFDDVLNQVKNAESDFQQVIFDVVGRIESAPNIS